MATGSTSGASTITIPDITQTIDQTWFIEPIGGPKHPINYLDRFPDEIYNKGIDSRLVKLMYALLGPSGIGWLRKNFLLARLELEEHGLNGFDLDSFYGDPFKFGRILDEIYEDDPDGVLPRAVWDAIRSRDAQYRSRAVDFLNGARMGNSPEGMHLVARSGLGHEVEIIENYRYLYDIHSDDPIGLTNFGQTNAVEEFIVLPRREVSRSEIQTVSVANSPTSGTFRLFFPMGSEVVNTTSQLAYNINRFDLKTALEALPSIGVGDIKTSGGPLPTEPIDVLFTGNLGGRDVPTLISSGSPTPTTTPSLRGVTNAASGSKVTSLAAPAPVGTIQDEDLLIMVVQLESVTTPTPTVTLPGGWAQIGTRANNTEASGAASVTVFGRFYDSLPMPTVAWDLLAFPSITVYAIKNVDQSNPINASAGVQVNAAGATAPVPGLTTTLDQAFVMAIISNSFGQNAAPLAGWTQDYDDLGTAIFSNPTIGATAGVIGSQTFTISGAHTSDTMMIAIIPPQSLGSDAIPDVVVTTSVGGADATEEIVDIAPIDMRHLQSALDRIRPVHTIPTFNSGSGFQKRQLWNQINSSSNFTEVIRYVTGSSGVPWPTTDSVHWIEANVEHEGPQARDMERHTYQSFHNVATVKATHSEDVITTSEHIGAFYQYQVLLYPPLAGVSDGQVFKATDALADYTEPLTVTSIVEPDGTNVMMINDIYPSDYQSLPGVPQIQTRPHFWASEERVAPNGESYQIDLGSVQSVNYVYFETMRKPVSIKVSYELSGSDDVADWYPVTLSSLLPSVTSLVFDPQSSNPWQVVEINFANALGEIPVTRRIKLDFIRREDSNSPFVQTDGTLLPWSIEVRNLRVGRNTSG